MHLHPPRTMDNLPDGIRPRSYLCLPLVDNTGKIQAIAEIMNTCQDPRVISYWLDTNSNGVLYVLQQFIGNVMKSVCKR